MKSLISILAVAVAALSFTPAALAETKTPAKPTAAKVAKPAPKKVVKPSKKPVVKAPKAVKAGKVAPKKTK